MTVLLTNIKEKIFVGIIDLLHHLRHVDSADEDWAVRLNTFRSFYNTNTFTRYGQISSYVIIIVPPHL